MNHYTGGEWRLTDEETARVLETGDEGDVIRAQDAKKKAYTANGGVILNPDALEDMYEALKAINSYLTAPYPENMALKKRAVELLDNALDKAEGK